MVLMYQIGQKIGSFAPSLFLFREGYFFIPNVRSDCIKFVNFFLLLLLLFQKRICVFFRYRHDEIPKTPEKRKRRAIFQVQLAYPYAIFQRIPDTKDPFRYLYASAGTIHESR